MTVCCKVKCTGLGVSSTTFLSPFHCTNKDQKDPQNYVEVSPTTLHHVISYLLWHLHMQIDLTSLIWLTNRKCREHLSLELPSASEIYLKKLMTDVEV